MILIKSQKDTKGIVIVIKKYNYVCDNGTYFN